MLLAGPRFIIDWLSDDDMIKAFAAWLFNMTAMYASGMRQLAWAMCWIGEELGMTFPYAGRW